MFVIVNSDEFIRKIRRAGRKNRVEVRVVRGAPRGGHVYLYYADRRTAVSMHGARKEIPTKLVAKMLKDLGLRKGDI